MPSTYDSLLRLELQATGENATTWGTKTNNNLELIADAIAGSVSINMLDANVTLSALDAVTDQSRKAVITLTGTLSATRNVIVPNVSKVYGISNATTGGYTVTVKTAAGSGVAVPASTARFVYCDGTNVLALTSPVDPATNTLTANLVGNVTGNVTGNLTGNVTGNLTGAVTGAASSNVLKAGDTMTGNLVISKGDPAIVWDKSASTGQNNVLRGATAGSPRWDILLGHAGTEGGTADGSDLFITRYNNSGAAIDNPVFISRATGTVTIQNLSLGAGNSVGSSGYVRLPGGVILQWASINVPDSGNTWTFPIAFPTACVNVQATPTASLTSPVAVNSVSTTQATFDIFASESSDVYVMAIGY